MTTGAIEAGVRIRYNIDMPADTYGPAWNGSTELPTKNAIYDKIETLGTVSDAVWVGTSAPVDPNIELWWDSDEPSVVGSAGSGITQEQAEDAVAALFAAGTHTNATVTYNDATPSLSIAASGGGSVSFATDAEVLAGTETTKALNPANLSNTETFIDPRKYGFSTAATGIVNSAALQAAIDAACGVANPVTTVRVASKRIILPGGNYLLNSQINIRSVMNLTIEGNGNCRLLANVNMTSIFDINGISNCSIGGITFSGSAGVQVDNAIYDYWDPAGAIRSNTNNSFYNIDIRDLDFITGIRVGKIGMGNQVDNTEFRNVRIFGGWTAGNTTRWQAGMYVGDDMSANNVLHHLYKANINAVRYGIDLAASQLAVYGAGFGSNEIDMRVSTTGYSYFHGIRTEHSQKLLEHKAAGGIPSQITISDVQCHTNDMAADGKLITFLHTGTLNIINMTVFTNSAVQPKVHIGNFVHPAKLIVNGFTIGGSGRVGDIPSSTFVLSPQATATVKGYQRLDAVSGTISIQDYNAGGTASVYTLGNNSINDPSALILNAPSTQPNILRYNRNGTPSWDFYDGNSQYLYFRDMVNSNMHIILYPGTAATGAVEIGTKLRYAAGVTDVAYGPSWDGSKEIPTRDAIYDKIETLGGSSTRTVTTYSGTSLTGVTGDAGSYLRFTGSNPTYTLPPNSSVAFPVGTQIDGVGTATAMTLVAGSGVTINKARTLVTVAADSGWTALKVATDEWDVHGDFV